MKAKELCILLKDFPDFEVVCNFIEINNSEYGINYRKSKAIGLGDIGYSDNVVNITFQEVN